MKNKRIKKRPLLRSAFLLILMASGLMSLFNSCKSKDELVALSKCEFRVKNASNITLAGIPVDDVDALSDLNYIDGLALLAAAASDNLPMSLIVNVEVRNPNNEMAALNKTDWKLFIDDLLITTGTHEERIEIPPFNGVAILSVPVTENLVTLLEGETGMALLNLALNLAEAGDQPSRITISARPYIYVGRRLIQYPGFIDISTEFTAGDV